MLNRIKSIPSANLHFQSRYIKKVKAMGKVAKSEEKERQRQARTVVAEGPLTFNEGFPSN